MKRILVIEDNNEINNMLTTALSQNGYYVKSAFSGTEGLLYFSMDEAYFGENNTINVHISNIRNKIKQFSDISYVETIWGIGFRAGGT